MDEATSAPVRKGRWTDEMLERLRTKYPAAREAGTLRELAGELGVELYDLYNKAHRIGLARQIRKR